MPVLDEKYFEFGYDEEHPPIVIPEEVEDDIDMDWEVSTGDKIDLLTQYAIDVAEALAA